MSQCWIRFIIFFPLFFHFKAKEGLMFCCVHVDEYNIVTHQEQENGCKRMWLTFVVDIKVLGCWRVLENKGRGLLFLANIMEWKWRDILYVYKTCGSAVMQDTVFRLDICVFVFVQHAGYGICEGMVWRPKLYVFFSYFVIYFWNTWR